MTPSEIRLLTIADREADIFEFLAEAADLDAEYVIRAAQDRRVAGKVVQLWAYMATQDVVGEVTVEVAARPGKPTRTAELRVRVAQVSLQPPLRPATMRECGKRSTLRSIVQRPCRRQCLRFVKRYAGLHNLAAS